MKEIQGGIVTKLCNGVEMPLLGLGVYDIYDAKAEQAIEWALETGYRLIDTASMYQNEREVGNAIRYSGLPRKEVFITTKVNNTEQGFDETLRAYEASCKKLQTDYVDLYLVHWPIRETRKQTWLALEKLYLEGRVRAIGVANYLIPFLDELKEYATVVPAVNQVEFSPFLNLNDLYLRSKNDSIQLQAYTPLVRGEKMKDARLVELAKKYNKTSAQIMLRWLIQKGISAIPKSASLERIRENFNIFDFQLSVEDSQLIETFDENLRLVDDPMTYF